MENNLPVQSPVFLIETNRISPNPQQPRRDFDEQELMELASSIREFGIIQPIVVTKIEKDTETGTQVEYQLIAGERRWRAAKIAGLERIPAIIRSINLERDRLELAIIENVQRANLNPIEAARAYAKLQDQFSLTQREIAVRIGKSRETIANVLRLLNLPTQLQEAVAKNTISESQARLLLSISDPIQQQTLFEDILKSSLSVRELKSRIQKIKTADQQEMSSSSSEITPSPELSSIQKTLEELLGTKVKIENGNPPAGGGKITFSFYSPEELQGIIQKLSKQPNQEQEQQDQISL